MPRHQDFGMSEGRRQAAEDISLVWSWIVVTAKLSRGLLVIALCKYISTSAPDFLVSGDLILELRTSDPAIEIVPDSDSALHKSLNSLSFPDVPMQLGTFAAHIVDVDGVPLKEYDTVFESPTRATCWIASEEGKVCRIYNVTSIFSRANFDGPRNLVCNGNVTRGGAPQALGGM